MQPLRLSTAHRVKGLLRGLTVLLACFGLASVSLAATGGSRARKNPGAAVVTHAQAHVGDTYTWGAAGPRTWDCSGLTSTLWRRVGGVKAIPRTARAQQAWAVPLPAAQVLAGDLVFFGNPVTHVGIVRSRTRRASGALVVHMIDAASSLKGVVARDVWRTGTVRYGRVPRTGMTRVRPWAKSPPVKARHSPVKARHSPAKKAPSSVLARKAARVAVAALANVQRARLTDVQFVRNVWHVAGGRALPRSRHGLRAAGTRVAHLRVGDLIFFPAPAAHVGIYVGGGRLVYASQSLGKVVLRHVQAAAGIQLVRIGR